MGAARGVHGPLSSYVLVWDPEQGVLRGCRRAGVPAVEVREVTWYLWGDTGGTPLLFPVGLAHSRCSASTHELFMGRAERVPGRVHLLGTRAALLPSLGGRGEVISADRMPPAALPARLCVAVGDWPWARGVGVFQEGCSG